MILQDITYLRLNFSVIPNINNSFKNNTQLKILYNNIKLVWGLNSSEIIPSISEINNVFKFSLKSGNTIFGFVIYIPEQKRIDIYSSENLQVPLVQVKNKKIVYKTYPLLLEKLGIEQLISKLYLSIL